jgi:hypothetical protein
MSEIVWTETAINDLNRHYDWFFGLYYAKWPFNALKPLLDKEFNNFY